METPGRPGLRPGAAISVGNAGGMTIGRGMGEGVAGGGIVNDAAVRVVLVMVVVVVPELVVMVGRTVTTALLSALDDVDDGRWLAAPTSHNQAHKSAQIFSLRADLGKMNCQISQKLEIGSAARLWLVSLPGTTIY